MKKTWITGGLILFVYLVATIGLTWYFVIPSSEEKQAVLVAPKMLNSQPVTDELAKVLKERQKYGNWPIDISADRLGKNNPFRQ